MVPRSLFFLPTWRKAMTHPVVLNQVPLHIDRCGHNAVCVNEDLIIWGGYYEPRYQACSYHENEILWVYNTEMDFWFCVQTTGDIPLYRSGAMSILVSHHWYIIGGHSHKGDVNDIHALNLRTLVWEKVIPQGPKNMPKRDKASAWLWNNRIYCFGGYGIRPYIDLWEPHEDEFILELPMPRGWNNQVVYFDVNSKEWIRPDVKGQKPKPRAAHSSTLVGDKVYVFGGRSQSQRLNDLHVLDLESCEWSDRIIVLGTEPCGRSWHSMTNMDGTRLLMFGGFSNDNTPLDDAWVLNVKTFSWSTLSLPAKFPRLWHSASFNFHGDVLVFGGCVSNILDNSRSMETSDKVIMFNLQPFSLQRLCLHSLFRDNSKTQMLWQELPKDLAQWLNDKLTLSTKNPSVLLGYPSLVSGSGQRLPSMCLGDL